jgi:hypothetical protein
MSQITQSKNTPIFIMTYSLILQAKLSLVEGDLEKVNDLLSEVEKIAAEKKIDTLLSQVQREQKRLETELEKWEGMIQRNISITERME